MSKQDETWVSRKKKFQKKKHRTRFLLVIGLIVGISAISVFFVFHKQILTLIQKQETIQEPLNKEQLTEPNNSTAVKNSDTITNPINYEIKKVDVNTTAQQDSPISSSSHIIPFLQDDRKLVTARTFDYFYRAPLTHFGPNSYLKLVFSHSELLKEDESSLTVLIDNIPVKSVRLTDENRNFYSMNIPLDKKFLTEGFHKLSFQFVGSLTEDDCEDILNPANWLILHQESYLFFDTKNYVQFDDMLKQFPYPFINEGMEKPLQAILVVPDQLTESLFTSVVKLSHFLSNQTSTREEVTILRESEVTEEWIASNHIIAIGTKDQWQSFMKDVLEKNDIKFPEDHMVLQSLIIESPTPHQLLLITATSDSLIEQHIDVVTNREYIQQLSGNYLAVATQPDFPERDNEKDGITLDMLGTEDIVLNSSSAASQSFQVPIPSYWSLQDHMEIHLNIRLSPLLIENEPNDTEERLGLTIFVNEEPFTIPIEELAEKMNQDNENGWEKPIPYKLRIPKEIIEEQISMNLQFQVNFINHELHCLKIDDSSRWIWIDKESTIDVPFDIPNEQSFANFPAPFTGKTDFNDVVFIPFGELTGEELTNLANMIASMGMYFDEIDQLQFRFNPTYEDILEYTNEHLVFIGTKTSFEQDPKWKEFIAPYFERLEKLQILHETADIVSWITPSFNNLDRSQWMIVHMEKEKAVLPNMENIVSFLMTSTNRGNVLVESKSGEILVTSLEENVPSPVSVGPGSMLKEHSLTIIGITAVFGIGVFLLMQLVRRKRKR